MDKHMTPHSEQAVICLLLYYHCPGILNNFTFELAFCKWSPKGQQSMHVYRRDEHHMCVFYPSLLPHFTYSVGDAPWTRFPYGITMHVSLVRLMRAQDERVMSMSLQVGEVSITPWERPYSVWTRTWIKCGGREGGKSRSKTYE